MTCNGCPTLYSLHGHVNHVLFGAVVWVMVAEHYKVTTFDQIFYERTGARPALIRKIQQLASCLLAALCYDR